MTSDLGYLFTYGTLMQGFQNSFAEKLHKLSTYAGKGYFNGFLYQITWYPGAIFDVNSDGKVHGEIYLLAPGNDLLKELDEYEDVFEDESASLYVRRIVPITTESRSVIPCWVYLYNQPVNDYLLISSGHFRH
ncbi:MAG: gamma-glutamylcyclotransferase family protein [Dyadobacter sp.]|uniref:gamma-glutamylcyclotransferase family protein n=1 Tax=Dyadobacter sp. TaxID=1914288 RepID=UPI0032670937